MAEKTFKERVEERKARRQSDVKQMENALKVLEQTPEMEDFMTVFLNDRNQ